MAGRKPKIVVAKEDSGIAQVVEDPAGGVVNAASIMHASKTLAADFMPGEKSVEDDERVYHFKTDEPGLPADHGSFDEELLEENLEASVENAARHEYEVDDFDIDEIFSFDDTLDPQVTEKLEHADGQGVPVLIVCADACESVHRALDTAGIKINCTESMALGSIEAEITADQMETVKYVPGVIYVELDESAKTPHYI